MLRKCRHIVHTVLRRFAVESFVYRYKMFSRTVKIKKLFTVNIKNRTAVHFLYYVFIPQESRYEPSRAALYSLAAVIELFAAVVWLQQHSAEIVECVYFNFGHIEIDIKRIL